MVMVRGLRFLSSVQLRVIEQGGGGLGVELGDGLGDGIGDGIGCVSGYGLGDGFGVEM